jgi:hypothetical protein
MTNATQTQTPIITADVINQAIHRDGSAGFTFQGRALYLVASGGAVWIAGQPLGIPLQYRTDGSGILHRLGLLGRSVVTLSEMVDNFDTIEAAVDRLIAKLERMAQN